MFHGVITKQDTIKNNFISNDILNHNDFKETKWSQGCCLDNECWKNSGVITSRYTSNNNEQGVIVYGKIYSIDSLQENQPVNAEQVWSFFQQKGVSFFNELNGDFIVVLWNATQDMTYIVRDPLGVLPLYYSEVKDALYFSDDLSFLSNLNKSSVSQYSLIQYLIYNYNPSINSIYENIKKVQSGHYLKIENNQVSMHPYWDLSFDANTLTEQEIIEILRDKLKKSVHNRIPSKGKTGTFLSGGLDSSSITSLLHQENVNPLYTFSFRCKGESFDESPFAEKVSNACSTKHHVVEYSPQSVQLIEDMVQYMDEPFSDVGINVATYLLSLTAKDKVNTLFTGDGGDELFAGHPVYLADISASYLKYIPGFLKSIVFSLGRQLKDSDKKKDLRVKIKRFSESYSYPAALGTHRWRAYYMPNKLSQLLEPDFRNDLVSSNVFDEMIQYNENGKQYDSLAQSLYSDYHTVVQFYLRRMDFVRKQGMWPQFPMLDKDVVKFCASIPSNLKIPSVSETKYIEKKTIEPWLPYEIVYRKDKLGHSIPLKNWMRYDHEVQSYMLDLLSVNQVKKMGIFNANMVQKMIQEHLSKKVNHSHRLWALMVFNLWMNQKSV